MKSNLSRNKSAALLLVGALLPWSAFAAEGGTWRCGNTYTDQPCNGGKALELDDTRSADQARAARESARDARTAADRMEKDRQRQEDTSARKRPILLIDQKPQGMDKTTSRNENVLQKPAKRKKDVVYVGAQGADSTPKKKAKKTKKSDE